MFKRLLILCLLSAPLFAAGQRASDFDPKAEDEIIALINQERTQRGLAPLIKDDRLTRAARVHTQLMVEKHELSHRLAEEPALRERVSVTGISFNAAGENVAYDANVQHAHVEFMHSPGHRANILGAKFNSVGVGVLRSGNLVWVTEDFAERIGVTSASEAAGIVINKFAAMRRAAGSPPATEHALPELGKMACDMAHKDHLDSHEAKNLPNVHEVMVWATPNPAELPSKLKNLADDRNSTTYSLGVCFAASPTYPSKVFWMVMTLY
ncbi:CAP domain-containing protein [Candidatus Korobacter versatilis]|uniref:CAP domain-containing protein n=1 Tax=Candidatus Korobacter versatilis TaxID=658062 RepID=UPI00030EC04C|nr:CAP domain-containing protein [Candidatus Koribacter versatilis]